VPVGLKITEGIRNVAKNNLDADRVRVNALVKVSVVESEVPLRIEGATQCFKDCGFGRIAPPDQAYESFVGQRPVQFANAAKVSDGEMTNSHRVSSLISVAEDCSI
jgi:hypothetical protein